MPTAQASPLLSLMPFILVMAVFYFLLIRPQQMQQKQHKEMITKLKKNDEVITIAGIHATIVNVKESTFIIRVDENVKIEIDKTAVASVKKVATA